MAGYRLRLCDAHEKTKRDESDNNDGGDSAHGNPPLLASYGAVWFFGTTYRMPAPHTPAALLLVSSDSFTALVKSTPIVKWQLFKAS